MFWLLTTTLPLTFEAPRPVSAVPLITPDEELLMVTLPVMVVAQMPFKPPLIRLPVLLIRRLPLTSATLTPVSEAPEMVPPVLFTVTLPLTPSTSIPSWPPEIEPLFWLLIKTLVGRAPPPDVMRTPSPLSPVILPEDELLIVTAPATLVSQTPSKPPKMVPWLLLISALPPMSNPPTPVRDASEIRPEVLLMVKLPVTLVPSTPGWAPRIVPLLLLTSILPKMLTP